MLMILNGLPLCYDTLLPRHSPGQRPSQTPGYRYRTLFAVLASFIMAADCQAQTEPNDVGGQQAKPAISERSVPPTESEPAAAVQPSESAKSSATDERTKIADPDSVAMPAPNPTIDDINQIRKQLGGGVAEQLNGMFRDDDQGQRQLQKDFDEQLRALNSRHDRPVDRSLESHPSNSPGRQTPRFQTPLPDRQVSQGYVANQSYSDRQQQVDATLRIKAIRQAARQLDETAADLEDYDLFEAADRLRDQAAVLRHQLR